MAPYLQSEKTRKLSDVLFVDRIEKKIGLLTSKSTADHDTKGSQSLAKIGRRNLLHSSFS